MDVKNKIIIAIQKCEEEIKGLNRYPTTPVIIESLQKMLQEVDKPDSCYEKRSKMAGAIGRIVTDDFNLMNSEIGKAVAEATNEFVR